MMAASRPLGRLFLLPLLCLLPVARAAVELRASDFAAGSVLLDQDDQTYVLMEDVAFNPNARATGGDGAPRPEQFKSAGGPYDDRAFQLGFFAAVVVTGHNVTLDLNGHTLEQSEEHALLMRFFAIVELASAPFIATQGPHDFATGPLVTPVTARVHNGVLGRSAHHGIHGNGPQVVVVENVVIRDFEVAALHLNGALDVRVTNVTAGPMRRDVPVLGRFSVGRFLLPYLRYLAHDTSCGNNGITVAGVLYSPEAVLANLEAALEQTYQAAIRGNGSVPELFANPSGLPDGGTVYGMVFNKLGVAVNGLANKRPDQPVDNTNIVLSNVTIRDIHAAPHEVVALARSDDGTAQTDAVGATFQYLTALDSAGNYVGNVMTTAQLMVNKYSMCFPQARLSTKRSTVSSWVTHWAAAGLQLHLSTSTKVCGGDTMFHVNKGVIGLRIDVGTQIELDRVTIEGVSSRGRPGSTECGNYVTSHPLATLPYYMGANAAGVVLAASANLHLTNLTVRNVTSYAGSATGMQVALYCNDITGQINVTDIKTLRGQPFQLGSYTGIPQEAPASRDIVLDDTVTDCTVTAWHTFSTTTTTAATTPARTTTASTSSTTRPQAQASSSNDTTTTTVVWVIVALVLVLVVAAAVVLVQRYRHRRTAAASAAATRPHSIVNPLYMDETMTNPTELTTTSEA